ncbi:MAG: AAA family ATPase, partial [Anaerolineales bacterium]|nr:AAA family ATPase [Anaerolineales bacterium]
MDMQLFGAYLPIDRRHALAQAYELDDRTKGAALFADISGFTPLTEALAQELGARRGAEELTQTLNTVYSALVQNVHLYHGSVIGFAGDAITCWFEQDDGLRAVSSALSMQAAMNEFRQIQTPGGQAVELAIKTAVAIGPVRRFLVGDPQIQVMDVLAGDTLSQMAAAEHMAERNEVVVTAEVASKLQEHLQLTAERQDADGHIYHVVGDLTTPITLPPWPQLPDDALTVDQMRPWLLPPVFSQLNTGQDTFLAELRPAVTLFLYFDGIEFDADDTAGEKLNQYVSWVQNVLAKYEGHLLQLIMGDKGSYLYAAFGAPLAHGDDAARAVAAALELRQPPDLLHFIAQTKVGISMGRLRAGAYGGTTRRTYGVLGDAVNTAARLMQAAKAGQVLVSPSVLEATRKQFLFNSVGELALKGKAEPLAVSEVVGHNSHAVQPTTLSLRPLIGREPEMAQMLSLLQAARQRHGRVVRLAGPAGIGKSHLALELVNQARQNGWHAVLSACQSTTQTTPYFPWRQVFRSLFGLDEGTEVDVAGQMEQVSTAVETINPDWMLRLPLLGDLLGLPIPENQATAAFDPRLRQEALFALAVDILHYHATRQPLLIFVDDVQWMDEASQGLTLNLARTLENQPIYLLVMHRPPLEVNRPILPDLTPLSTHHQLDVDELSSEAVTMLAAFRLGAPLAPLVNEVIQSLAQGNPFFTEELVASLREGQQLVLVARERGEQWELADFVFEALREANCLIKREDEWRLAEEISLSAAALGVPDSIHGLVLARLDRLNEEEKLTLKVASVI